MPAKSRKLVLEQCAEAASSCACLNFRKASRAVTQHFDETLASTGLRSTQLVILAVSAGAGGASLAQLARELVMDRSTLSRNVRPLVRDGLIKVIRKPHRRTAQVELTAKGRQTLHRAMPLWKKAQTRFIAHLGDDRWNTLVASLRDSVAIVRNGAAHAHRD